MITLTMDVEAVNQIANHPDVRPFLGGDIGLNGFVRRDPGHFAAQGNDVGGAVRVTLGF